MKEPSQELRVKYAYKGGCHGVTHVPADQVSSEEPSQELRVKYAYKGGCHGVTHVPADQVLVQAIYGIHLS